MSLLKTNLNKYQNSIWTIFSLISSSNSNGRICSKFGWLRDIATIFSILSK